MLDSENMTFYQPATGVSYVWPMENDAYLPLYGVFVEALLQEGGNTLMLAETVEDLLVDDYQYLGTHEYTVSALKPDSMGSSILNLTFLGFQFEHGSGIMLFNTISQTGLDNPNKLDVQTGHIQIDYRTIFKMDYLKNTCDEISESVKTTW